MNTPLAPETRKKLMEEWNRRQNALTEGQDDIAERCLLNMDLILDRRPRPIAVASDGEVIWSDAPPWIVDQVEPGLRQATGGGVGLLERPKFDPADIARWTKQARKELGIE